MAAVEFDGAGAPAPKPTTTASGAMRTTSSEDRRPPTLLPAAGTPTRPKGTAYNKLVVADAPASKLTDAIRGNTKRTETGDEPTTISRSVAKTSRERRGTKTSNDGRADQLNVGGHKGNRDEVISELKASKAKLQTERTELKGKIGVLDEEISANEDKAEKTGDIVGAVTAPVGMVAGLFGKENPIAEQAEDIAGSILGIKADKAELEQTEAELAAQEAEIDEQIADLENERALNFLADVAHVTNMPTAVADVLEGSKGLSIVVKDETGIGSDAAYDRVEKSIVIDDDVMETVSETLTELKGDGIVDADGNIVDAEGFDASAAGDKAIGATALVGVHEVTHAAQDERGKIERVHARGEQLMELARSQAELLGGNGGGMGGAVAKAAAMVDRATVDSIEYASYVNQETIELQAGKEKQVFTTIDASGAPLPREQAVENIKALQLGLPMLHGVSKGESVPGSGSNDDSHDHEHGDEHADEQVRVQTMTMLDSVLGGKMSGGDLFGGKMSGGDETGGKMSGGDLFGGKMSGGKMSGGDDLG